MAPSTHEQSPDHGHRHGGAVRGLAVLSTLALLVGSMSPGLALAHEAESEGQGEGAAPPGLEEPDFEPGGPEVALESVPGTAGAEEVEGEEVEPVEAAPAQEPVPAETGAIVEPEPTEETMPPQEPPAVEPAPAPSPGLAYTPTTAPAGPEYEAATPAQAEPVENEALVAPPSSATRPAGHDGGRKAGVSAAPAPASPSEEQEPEGPARAPSVPSAPEQSAVAQAESGPRGSLAGRPSYTVRPGDCLWSIAEAALPSGADDARIAAEVARLWRLNAGRIGTGDPGLIYAGTVLRRG